MATPRELVKFYINIAGRFGVARPVGADHVFSNGKA